MHLKKISDNKVKIRAAQVDELSSIQRLLVETWHDTYDAIYEVARVNEITSQWHSLQNLNKQIAQAGTVFLVLEQDTEIKATSFASCSEHGEIMLHRLYVLPQHHGQGIGAGLLSATVAAFATARLVRLEVEPENTKAIAFYKRHGFAIVGTAADCGVVGSQIKAIIMEKQLDGYPAV